MPAWFVARYPSGAVGMLGQAERTTAGDYGLDINGVMMDWRDVYIFAKVEHGNLCS